MTPLSLSCHGDSQLPPLVLLHGFLGSQSDWQPLLPYLTKQFYCVCIDLPGHGGSAAIELPVPGFSRTCQLIRDTLAQLGIHRFHLLGYSLGGRIALHLADELNQQQPGALLSLGLESCHPGLQTENDILARQHNDTAWADKLAQLPLTEFLPLWYRQGVFAELSESARAALVEKRRHANRLGLLNCYRATSLALQQDLRGVPAQMPGRCYFLAGQQDSKFSALAQRWQQQQPLRCIAIPDAGHNIHLANPAAMATTLIEEAALSPAPALNEHPSQAKTPSPQRHKPDKRHE